MITEFFKNIVKQPVTTVIGLATGVLNYYAGNLQSFTWKGLLALLPSLILFGAGDPKKK